MPIQSVLLGFPFQVQVAARLPNGTTDTSFTGPMTIALEDPGFDASLNGVLTRNALAGVATFPGLAITKVGVNYQLSCTSTGYAEVLSNPFSVVAPSVAPGWYVVEVGPGEVLNANIFNMFVALYGGPPSVANVFVHVLPDALVGSSSISTPSIDFGAGFNIAGTTFLFQNDGDVMGRGGNAGLVTDLSGGQDGGDAINFRGYTVIVDNREKIYAGGGGGDSPDDQRRVTNILAGCGSGCWGANGHVLVRALSGGSGGGAGHPGGLGSAAMTGIGFGGTHIDGGVGGTQGFGGGDDVSQSFAEDGNVDETISDGTSYVSGLVTASSSAFVNGAGEAEDGEDGSSEGLGAAGIGAPAGSYGISTAASFNPACIASTTTGNAGGTYTPGDDGYDGGDFGEAGDGANGGDAGVAILGTGIIYWIEEGDIKGAVPA